MEMEIILHHHPIPDNIDMVLSILVVCVCVCVCVCGKTQVEKE